MRRIIGASGFGSSHRVTRYVRTLLRDAPHNVQFAGYRPGSALAEEFRRAHIFSCPSVWEEPFGLVNVEAMASGLASVSTRSGGIPEIFAEGGGILVNPNSGEELAAALERLITDDALRLKIGRDAYQNFKRNFTWRSVHKRYGELLASLP